VDIGCTGGADDDGERAIGAAVCGGQRDVPCPG
jgi:hypothetical protein